MHFDHFNHSVFIYFQFLLSRSLSFYSHVDYSYFIILIDFEIWNLNF